MKNIKEEKLTILKELKTMYELDQKMRNEFDYDKDNWDDKIDKQHTEKLKEIINKIGYPTISKVGKSWSLYAWLLSQHADHDLEFQKKCL